MASRQISPEKLAQSSGIHRSTISRLLSGNRSPNLDTVTRLMAALGGSSTDAGIPLDVGVDPAAGADVERSIRADPNLSEAARQELIRSYRRMRS